MVNTKSHQHFWGDWEMGTAILCKKGSDKCVSVYVCVCAGVMGYLYND